MLIIGATSLKLPGVLREVDSGGLSFDSPPPGCLLDHFVELMFGIAVQVWRHFFCFSKGFPLKSKGFSSERSQYFKLIWGVLGTSLEVRGKRAKQFNQIPVVPCSRASIANAEELPSFLRGATCCQSFCTKTTPFVLKAETKRSCEPTAGVSLTAVSRRRHAVDVSPGIPEPGHRELPVGGRGLQQAGGWRGGLAEPMWGRTSFFEAGVWWL